MQHALAEVHVAFSEALAGRGENNSLFGRIDEIEQFRRSSATLRKNHPPDIDIRLFQTKFIAANGNSTIRSFSRAIQSDHSRNFIEVRR